MNDYLSTLGLCLRAGRLTVGIEAVLDKAGTGEARLILLSADAGESVTRRVRSAAAEKEIPVIRLGADSGNIGASLGRAACAVCSISEIGFAAGVAAKAAQENPVWKTIAQKLEEKNSRIASRRGKKKPRQAARGVRGVNGVRQARQKKGGGERA